jgi:hypothetical protein
MTVLLHQLPPVLPLEVAMKKQIHRTAWESLLGRF